MKKIKLIFCILFLCQTFSSLVAQGYNHQWLLGNFYFIQDPKGRATFDTATSTFVTEFRKMSFLGTQGNICDANGSFLMSSNGIWIANANNDTMLNGGGLNPGLFASQWPYGMPIVANCVFVPSPSDTNKYLLIHHTANPTTFNSNELFLSQIDITKNGGLGEVVIKNQLIFIDTLNWGIGACRHSNGRDWWVVTVKDSSSIFIKSLITPTLIPVTAFQNVTFNPISNKTTSQLTFSNDGKKFLATTYDNPIDRNSYLVLSDFNRCTGLFSNTQTLQLTHNAYLWGLAFSPSGEFIYACSSGYLFQVNATTLTIDTVATFDGFISPPGASCCYTDFFNMYLAANGKIYITSGSSVQHLGVINNPDSAGLLCDVQQHSIDLVDYLHLRAVPNHPNYYLGCDTSLGCGCATGISENGTHDFRFRIYPNPVVNNFVNVGYILPQNKSGILKLYDINGKQLYTQGLPPWSNEQSIKLPKLANEIYNLRIESSGYFMSRNLVVMGEK